jgi:hypothetical protein
LSENSPALFATLLLAEFMKRLTHTQLSLIGLSVLGLIGSAILLKFAPVPFLWSFVLWGLVFVTLAYVSKGANLRAVFCNLAIIGLFLAVAELYFWRAQAKPSEHGSDEVSYRMEGGINDGYRDLNHPILGYAAKKGVIADAQKYRGDELVYDVVYTIDDNGLRRSAPVDPSNLRGCIFFFGGSFTIGEGVEDHESMPYRVGVLTEGQYRIFNFGFHGYGPHQMLSALESGLVRDIAQCKPRFVVYQALDRHVLRTAGLVHWGKNGPRYVLEEDGRVRRAGTFADKPAATRFTDAFLRQSGKSHLYTWIRGRSKSYQVSDEHIATFGAIVEQARDIALADNPRGVFHVLLWNFDTALTRRVTNELAVRNVKVHPVLESILPAAAYRTTYALGPHDHHPNPATYDLIARYVVGHIITPGQESAK